jgi:predicted nucleic acid-binding Zn ribbon protein
MGRYDEPADIKQILDRLFGASKNKPDFDIVKLRKKWKEIVGNELVAHTKPIKISGNILYIKVDHQGWVNTLQFYKNDMIGNIKKEFQDKIIINDLKFTF